MFGKIVSPFDKIYIVAANLPTEGFPSCLHTTAASLLSHIWLHTVPHLLLRQISTRPCKLVPFASLTSPSVQPNSTHQ